jgi:Na+/H+ antiporter NhaA
MESKRRRAVAFIVLGSFAIGVAAINIAQGSKGWVTDSSRFTFMAGLFVCGIAGGWFGWKQLRKLKEQMPDLSWWQFLRTELIVLMLLFFLALGIGVLPEEKRQDLANFLHEMNIALRGHP